MESEPQPYSVQLTDTAVSNLRRYPRDDQRRIVGKLEQMAKDPLVMRNVKKLADFDVTYRLRVGDYRILFDRDDDNRIIDVIDILPRSRAYRRK